MENPFPVHWRDALDSSSDSDSSDTPSMRRRPHHKRGGTSSPTSVVEGSAAFFHSNPHAAASAASRSSLWFTGDWATAGRDQQAAASRRASDASAAGSSAAPPAAHKPMPGWYYCVLYSASACLLQVMNKVFLKRWGVPCVFALSFSQAVVAVCVLSLSSSLGIYRMPSITPSSLLRMLPLSLISLGNSAAGMAGLRLLSLPMYLNLRRLVTPTSLVMDYALFGRTQKPGIAASVLILATGSLIAGASDAEYSPAGYALTLLANVFTVGHSMYTKHVADGGRGPCVLDMLFFNSLVGMPILLTCSLLAGEWGRIAQSPALADPARLAAELSLSIGMALTYQVSLFACTSHNTPLATSISGNFKDLASSVAGVALDSGWPSGTSVFGLGMSICGAFSYVYQKAGSLGGGGRRASLGGEGRGGRRGGGRYVLRDVPRVKFQHM